ncbi:11414_t:CDS:10, partial [Funneliformis caledonium]
ECCMKTQSTIRYDVIREHVEKLFRVFKLPLLCIPQITNFHDVPILKKNVEYIRVSEVMGNASEFQTLENVILNIHIYQLNEDDAIEEYQDDENLLTAHHWDLPARALDGLWDNLIFDENIKTRLLEYVFTTMLFSDRKVNTNIISWNRVVLLHGPPGTGKTTFCRAFAQKLSIRLADRYSHVKLFEINSHSLFSKWFSESGKLVQKLFQQISELIEEEGSFVCVLIDEVESLTAVRKSALTGAEPSDAVRVVNAVLTQIDKLKQKNNVLILSTSNITEAIDIAFIDRADIKQYIGLPSRQAIYAILSSCIQELMKVGIIMKENLLDWSTVKLTNDFEDSNFRLYTISGKCLGMSGRTLRKMPFLAYARSIHSKNTTTFKNFLKALDETVIEESTSRKLIMENQNMMNRC